jgi:hypothetical protein
VALRIEDLSLGLPQIPGRARRILDWKEEWGLAADEAHEGVIPLRTCMASHVCR